MLSNYPPGVTDQTISALYSSNRDQDCYNPACDNVLPGQDGEDAYCPTVWGNPGVPDDFIFCDEDCYKMYLRDCEEAAADPDDD